MTSKKLKVDICNVSILKVGLKVYSTCETDQAYYGIRIYGNQGNCFYDRTFNSDLDVSKKAEWFYQDIEKN